MPKEPAALKTQRVMDLQSHCELLSHCDLLLQSHLVRTPIRQTNFIPLLVLVRRGAVPVIISTGNKFPRKIPENSTNLVPILVPSFGEISALQYCTGNFQSPTISLVL